MPIQTRFLRPVGIRAWLRIHWGQTACFNGSDHSAMVHLMDSCAVDDWELGGSAAEYADERWPTVCDHCHAGAPPLSVVRRCCLAPGCSGVRPLVQRQVFRKPLYQPPEGESRSELEPGDLYYANWYPCAEGGPCLYGWTNCDGRHLVVILPTADRWAWDLSSRASNCTRKDDTLHRCWIWHGDPEQGGVHVDKNGDTCEAGDGFILVPGYHGTLSHGVLTD